MSKKNSSANLKDIFIFDRYLSSIFLNFKNKLDRLNKKKYVVAVSGGPDSLALAALTKAYSYQKKLKFCYILIDHKLRKNSHLEALRTKKLLKKQKINLKILINKKKINKNVQAEARVTRYEILTKYCKKNNIGIVITAHNLEDQVETFLIRLSRGSGLKGLSSMKLLSKIENKVVLFRPLLDVKKEHLINISKNIFGKYIKDPSNKDLKFLRTRVRNLKKPLENSGIKYEQIFKSIQNLSYSKDILERQFNNIYKNLVKKKNQEILINFKKYKKLELEIKIALINQSVKKLRKNYYDIRSKKVINLIKNINKSNFKKSTLGGCIFFKKGENLCLKVEKF